MRPLDPRLVVRVGPARRYILTTAALGLVTAVLILLQALLIARLLAPALSPSPLISDGLGWWGVVVPLETRVLATGLPWLAVVVVLRAAVAMLQERLAHRAGTQVISQLRTQVVQHAADLGPRWAATGRGTDVATLVTRGLDNLLPYFVRYLPQLMLASTVTPLMLVVVLGLDWLSAVIVLATLPLVPIFMVLVGLLTREKSARHLESMQRLGSRTLDLVAGLPTLRALGRQHGPAARVRELGEAHRTATMGSLRIAFLSGMVLELLTTLSVALVAVTMGFRLVDGHLTIEVALAVLVLAPEVYLPLRNVGVHFHASADGLAAADQAFDVLDEPLTTRARIGDAPSLTGATITADALGVLTPDGHRYAPGAMSVHATAGAITVLAGPNGDGKTTALLVLAGLLPPDLGSVSATTPDGASHLLADADGAVDVDAWSAQCAWVPQRPDLGPQGRTLSLGQRQRKALARAFESGRPVLLLDEPTAHLDRASRSEVIAQMRAAADRGVVVIVATHETEVMDIADATVTVTATHATDGALR
jgi:ATP-binding cassette subfamily C protein CydD